MPLDTAPTVVRSPQLLWATLGMVAVLFLCDLLADGVTVALFYPLAMIVLVRAGYSQQLRWATLALVLMVLAAHFLKCWWYSAPLAVDYRLANRGLIAIGLAALYLLLQCRLVGQWRQHEPELPEHFLRDEAEINETLAVCLGGLAMLLIAAADIALPANYNLAVLYIAPLFLCVWLRNRRLLWAVAGASLLLTYLGFVLGPPPMQGFYLQALGINRMLTGLAILLTAVLLHFKVETTQGADSLPVAMSQTWRRSMASIGGRGR